MAKSKFRKLKACILPVLIKELSKAKPFYLKHSKKKLANKLEAGGIQGGNYYPRCK
jgi:hypothetical protein